MKILSHVEITEKGLKVLHCNLPVNFLNLYVLSAEIVQEALLGETKIM